MKEKGKWQTAAEAIIADRKKANQVDQTISTRFVHDRNFNFLKRIYRVFHTNDNYTRDYES